MIWWNIAVLPSAKTVRLLWLIQTSEITKVTINMPRRENFFYFPFQCTISLAVHQQLFRITLQLLSSKKLKFLKHFGFTCGKKKKGCQIWNSPGSICNLSCSELFQQHLAPVYYLAYLGFQTYICTKAAAADLLLKFCF